MEHSEFRGHYLNGKLAVKVNKEKAGFFYTQSGPIPQFRRKRQAFIRTLAFSGLLGGIVLFFVTDWWIATAVLLLGLFNFPRAQKDAASGVLETCLENKELYDHCISEGILTFGQVNSDD